MADVIKTLSSQLAQDPDSLVFLRLGELLRQKGQLDTAHRVALTGLERHPHLPDAHDLYARILADKHDSERAFDEWGMARPTAPARVGAQEGLLLLDASGRVLGGALKDPAGRDVTDAVAAYLAGVSQEAARTVKLLALGKWTGLAAEGNLGHVHLAPPSSDALLLVVRDRAVPMGRLAIIAQRAALAARRWLEAHA